jgi:hypothetical protein
MVTGSLEYYILNLLHQHRSRTIVREYLVRDAVGTKALHWVLHSDVYNRTEFILSTRFLAAIAFGITAEGPETEELIWEWVASGHVPTQYANVNDNTTLASFRARLFRHLIGYTAAERSTDVC